MRLLSTGVSATTPSITALNNLAEFDCLLDARTPAEFELDHLPLAENAPVLSNEQRIVIGTLYKQQSGFEAKRLGAAFVARNIGDLIEARFQNKPRDWSPLVYCWRGGNRSGSLTHILRAVGWRATQLEGGYKAYRTFVIEQLAHIPKQFHYHVLCGPTGSGKSLMLQALVRAGAQVLDLEAIANHRGSVLGDLPDINQPSQKRFESLVWQALKGFSADQPIFVESESKRIGKLQVPDVLLEHMRQSSCSRIDLPNDYRVQLLQNEYEHFVHNPALLHEKLNHLAEFYANDTLARWRAQVDNNEWSAFVADMLEHHYDPLYHRSLHTNYIGAINAIPITPRGIDTASFDLAACELIERANTMHPSTQRALSNA
jgi:tRNA 2-selenouridine synthase